MQFSEVLVFIHEQSFFKIKDERGTLSPLLVAAVVIVLPFFVYLLALKSTVYNKLACFGLSFFINENGVKYFKGE